MRTPNYSMTRETRGLTFARIVVPHRGQVPTVREYPVRRISGAKTDCLGTGHKTGHLEGWTE